MGVSVSIGIYSVIYYIIPCPLRTQDSSTATTVK